MTKFAALVALAAVLATPAWTATRTVTLSVPGMTCAACPITVKKALSRVTGVLEAEVSYEKREVAGNFDDVNASVEALTRAAANAGYPASMKE